MFCKLFSINSNVIRKSNKNLNKKNIYDNLGSYVYYDNQLKQRYLQTRLPKTNINIDNSDYEEPMNSQIQLNDNSEQPEFDNNMNEPIDNNNYLDESDSFINNNEENYSDYNNESIDEEYINDSQYNDLEQIDENQQLNELENNKNFEEYIQEQNSETEQYNELEEKIEPDIENNQEYIDSNINDIDILTSENNQIIQDDINQNMSLDDSATEEQNLVDNVTSDTIIDDKDLYEEKLINKYDDNETFPAEETNQSQVININTDMEDNDINYIDDNADSQYTENTENSSLNIDEANDMNQPIENNNSEINYNSEEESVIVSSDSKNLDNEYNADENNSILGNEESDIYDSQNLLDKNNIDEYPEENTSIQNKANDDNFYNNDNHLNDQEDINQEASEILENQNLIDNQSDSINNFPIDNKEDIIQSNDINNENELANEDTNYSENNYIDNNEDKESSLVDIADSNIQVNNGGDKSNLIDEIDDTKVPIDSSKEDSSNINFPQENNNNIEDSLDSSEFIDNLNEGNNYNNIEETEEDSEEITEESNLESLVDNYNTTDIYDYLDNNNNNNNINDFDYDTNEETNIDNYDNSSDINTSQECNYDQISINNKCYSCPEMTLIQTINNEQVKYCRCYGYNNSIDEYIAKISPEDLNNNVLCCDNKVFDITLGECVNCPENTYYHQYKCVKCEENSFFYKGECITCPENSIKIKNKLLDIGCMCQNDNGFIYDLETNSCSLCSIFHYKKDNKCIKCKEYQFRQQDNDYCEYCPNRKLFNHRVYNEYISDVYSYVNTINKSNVQEKMCDNQCKSNQKINNETNECKYCHNITKYTRYNIDTNSCEYCPQHYKFNEAYFNQNPNASYNNICTICSDSTEYVNHTTNICFKCSKGYVFNDKTNTCDLKCPNCENYNKNINSSYYSNCIKNICYNKKPIALVDIDNPSNNKKKCPKYTILDSEYNCMTCKEEAFKLFNSESYNLFYKEGTCVSKCGNGYYLDNSNICTNCNIREDSEEYKDSCNKKACFFEELINANIKKYYYNYRCYNECPNNTGYISSELQNINNQIDFYVLECFICRTLKTNIYYYNNKCLKSCPNDMIFDNEYKCIENSCNNINCLNNSKCKIDLLTNKPKCFCTSNYIGKYCEINKDNESEIVKYNDYMLSYIESSFDKDNKDQPDKLLLEEDAINEIEKIVTENKITNTDNINNIKTNVLNLYSKMSNNIVSYNIFENKYTNEEIISVNKDIEDKINILSKMFEVLFVIEETFITKNELRYLQIDNLNKEDLDKKFKDLIYNLSYIKVRNKLNSNVYFKGKYINYQIYSKKNLNDYKSYVFKNLINNLNIDNCIDRYYKANFNKELLIVISAYSDKYFNNIMLKDRNDNNLIDLGLFYLNIFEYNNNKKNNYTESDIKNISIYDLCKNVEYTKSFNFVNSNVIDNTLFNSYYAQHINIYDKNYTNILENKCLSLKNITNNQEIDYYSRHKVFSKYSILCENNCYLDSILDNNIINCKCIATKNQKSNLISIHSSKLIIRNIEIKNYNLNLKNFSILNFNNSDNFQLSLLNKCYQYIFDSAVLKTNPGFYVMIFIVILCIILPLLIFILKVVFFNSKKKYISNSSLVSNSFKLHSNLITYSSIIQYIKSINYFKNVNNYNKQNRNICNYNTFYKNNLKNNKKEDNEDNNLVISLHNINESSNLSSPKCKKATTNYAIKNGKIIDLTELIKNEKIKDKEYIDNILELKSNINNYKFRGKLNKKENYNLVSMSPNKSVKNGSLCNIEEYSNNYNNNKYNKVYDSPLFNSPLAMKKKVINYNKLPSSYRIIGIRRHNSIHHSYKFTTNCKDSFSEYVSITYNNINSKRLSTLIVPKNLNRLCVLNNNDYKYISIKEFMFFLNLSNVIRFIFDYNLENNVLLSIFFNKNIWMSNYLLIIRLLTGSSVILFGNALFYSDIYRYDMNTYSNNKVNIILINIYLNYNLFHRMMSYIESLHIIIRNTLLVLH